MHERKMPIMKEQSHVFVELQDILFFVFLLEGVLL
jgi:hypothetical protein